MLWTPTKADGTLIAYDGATPNCVNRAQSGARRRTSTAATNINQVNTSGTVDITLTNASFLSARGGLFHDRYTDTGVSDGHVVHLRQLDDVGERDHSGERCRAARAS